MKKHLNKRSTVFMQIFSSMILIAFAIIVIMVTVISLWFRSEIVIELHKQKRISLMNLEQTLIHYAETTNKAIQLLILDPKIRGVIYDADVVWSNDVYTVSNLIGGILNVNPYIESVFLLRADHSLMKFSNRDQSIRFEEKLYEIIISGEKDVYWKCENVNGTFGNFHTIIIEDRYTNNNLGSENAVILTVNLDEIAKRVFSEGSKTDESTFVVNTVNQIIMGSDSSIITDQFSDAQLISFMEDDKQFQVITTKNGLSTSIYQSGKGFTIINTMQQPLGVRILMSIIIVVGVVGLVVFVLANIGALVLARRIYSPIHGVFTNIKNLFSSDTDVPQTSSSEIQQLSHSMTNAINLMHDLERKKENEVFHSLIRHQVFLQEEQMLHRINQLNLFDWAGQRYLLAVLRMRFFKDFIANHTDLTIDFQFNSIQILFQDFLKNRADYRTFIVNEQEIVVVFKENRDRPLNSVQLIGFMGGFVQYVKTTLNILLVVGMSQIYTESHLIKQSYDKAIELLDRSFILFNPTVITEKEHVDVELCRIDLKKACEACITSTKEGNKALFVDELRKLFSLLQSYPYEETVKDLLWLALKMRHIKDQVLESEETPYAKFYEEIITIKEVEALENWFYGLFDDINLKMIAYRELKVNDLLEKAIVFVQHHYNDVNLSVNQLASTLGVTPVYFGKLFNDAYQQSFPDYVNDLRLSKAQSLLKERLDLDIVDICNEVGFGSASYFASKFKKKYGITPSKFRINLIYHNMV